ncbi:CapA family protein [Eubacterium sp.]|uniref:CapA family protein n=1 Tax=Eubacterium sp. TaxID=142586 RepID=UPI003F110FF4
MSKSDILIFGDICPDNDYKQLYGYNGKSVFDEKIKALVNDSGLVVGNLECPATKSISVIKKCGPVLKAEPEEIKYLSEFGFDVFSLANNHILDYGKDAVLDTINTLNEYKLKHFGADINEEKSKSPLIIEINGKKVGLLSFAEAEFNLAMGDDPGANHFDPYSSFDDIVNLKKSCDYVIVLYHGGIEYYVNPSPLLQKKCRKMAKSGADLILCQHSHCIGTIEKIDGSTIIYGQGNAAFGYREGNDSWNEGFIVSVSLDDNSVNLHLINAVENGVVLADEIDSQNRIERMIKESEHLDDSIWIKEEWNKYCDKQKALYLPLIYGKNRVFNKVNRILDNLLIKLLFNSKKQRITMNLIRCEAHHEVIQTIFENKIF